MVSAHNPNPLYITLAFIILTVFTISFTENLQLADGLAQVGNRLIYELDVGESQVLQWGMENTQDTQVEIQFYATGTGSELMHFEEFAILEAGEFRNFDFIVVVPDDHPDNVEYQIELNALDRGSPLQAGETGVQVMAQMQQNPRIYIGDNPIYKYEAPPQVEITAEQIIITPNTALAPGQEAPTGETLQEKLDRIARANVKPETTVDDVWEEVAVPELIVDDNYLPEPVADPEPVAVQTTEKVECGFIDWLLSLFGMGKC